MFRVEVNIIRYEDIILVYKVNMEICYNDLPYTAIMEMTTFTTRN